MTNIINTRVISMRPTISNKTTTIVGVFQGVVQPPIPPPPKFLIIFRPFVFVAIRARVGIFFPLFIRPLVVFRVF